MNLYKLTDQYQQTRNSTQWGPGIEHTASGKGKVCGPGWLHAYTDPLLALMLNPIHARIPNPLLWTAEGDVGLRDRGLKVGCTRLQTIQLLKIPNITLEYRARFAILCAKEVCKNYEWNQWADNWLNGKDRSVRTAEALAYVARYQSGYEAAYTASYAAAYATEYVTDYTERYVAHSIDAAASIQKIDFLILASRAHNDP